MAIPKSGPGSGRLNIFMRDRLAELNEKSPVLDTKWEVQEVTPAYHSSGYYGKWEDEVMVESRIFVTEQEADDFIEAHYPNPGNIFMKVKYNLREFCEKRWVSY